MAQYMAPTTISDETTKDTAVSDRRGDIVFGLVARMAGWLILLVMAGIIIVLVAGGWRALANFGPQFFTSTAWDPVTQHFGAATSIFGTLVTTLVALVFAVPFAFGVAFWLVEMAPPALARVIETAVQLLAAVPSIIFGMWGFFIVVPFMAHHVEPATKHMLGHVPGVGLLFSGAPYGTGLLTGGVVLALMVTPFICSVMSDVFTSIPAVLKESAFGLGATRWEVMRKVVVPWSRQAVMGGIMLGTGRALGETMAVTFVIGNANHMGWSLFAPGNTIASLIALEFPESPAGSLKLSALLALGAILMIISFITLACSRIFLRRGAAE
ncbi:phosphate ABC transporter permease subunit PstC [Novacetimonas hansenii]|uniref:Phosphate transport system permease protein n=3 Tax=Novacetimonas hansenii TaxID=436 RepID=A0ABQ0SJQ1_NOVHA|nr:phosphate ABC transporter, inner membrane subunit PstC [Novacetimonas hansenii ATCC 23769]MBL7236813.1 phosphate ABC transporter permease subunit PstC [Novacetimonas hansenii]GAN84252.1 ABC transporter phosphate permease PstC [Novacetimonas hansenii JCM 7643]GBQ57967.1 phosphate ABC transporter permease [Novacetimonas hansenii NRIC 0243]QOF95537.1 phosphate ABC transporter permease subunit PstC [Novacetimonas hansenii]